MFLRTRGEWKVHATRVIEKHLDSPSIQLVELQQRVLARIIRCRVEVSRLAPGGSLISERSNHRYLVAHWEDTRNSEDTSGLLFLILVLPITFLGGWASNVGLRLVNLGVDGTLFTSQVRLLDTFDRLVDDTRQVVVINANVPNSNDLLAVVLFGTGTTRREGGFCSRREERRCKLAPND